MKKILGFLTIVAACLLLVAVLFYLFDRDYGVFSKTPGVDKNLLSQGENLYKSNTCLDCHGEEGKKPLLESYPRLNGQTQEYLFTQMQLIKTGERDSGQSSLMRPVVEKLSDEELQSLALYLSLQD